MKNLKFIAFLILSSLLIFSCKDDEKDNGVLPQEEAATSLNGMSSEMAADITEMVNSEGTESLTDLVDLISNDDIFSGRVDTDLTSSQILVQKLKNMKRVFIPRAVNEQNGRFDFNANLGIYNYDPDSAYFIKANDIIDHIQINFPTKLSDANNATLRVLAYTDAMITNDFDSVEYLPSTMQADLTVNTTLVVSLDFDASYQDDGMPATADVSLFIIPFDYTLKFDNTGAKTSSASFGIAKENTTIIGTSVAVTFVGPLKKVIDNAEGEIVFRSYALKGDVDVNGFDDADSSGADIDINDYFNLALYIDNNKIGDIVLEKSTTIEGDYDAYIVYADGSKELLETVFTPVIDEVENFLMQFDEG